ncbi:MAG: phosphodiester glycosidase family protein [Bacteroidales bacterium]|nr:phosphodiester glycosidase family protein [Bacteroidales bacterium]
MKQRFLCLISVLMLMVLSTGCCNDNSIGRSMSRVESTSVESLMQARQSGLEYVELVVGKNKVQDVAELQVWVEELKSKIDSSGLKVWSLHLPYGKHLDVSHPDSARRAENVNYIKEIIKASSVLSPRYLILHPSAEPVHPDERAYRLQLSRASIAELAPVAQEIGAELCVENLPRTCLGQNSREMMALTEGIEGVGICFDVNHLVYQSYDDFFKGIKKGAIKTVHISDFDFADERHLLPGVGKIEWEPLWAQIRANGYKGIMMFECRGEVSDLLQARDLLTGKVKQEISTVDADSLAFCQADWQITDLGKGAQAMYAQVPMFFSTQSICAIKYPASEFKSQILHRPGKKAGKPSVLGKQMGADFAVNAGYFHVKPRTPSVYFRIGNEVYGHTHPTETYRVDGVVGFKDKAGHEMMIAYSDTTQYQTVTADWHTVMASGPMLVVDGELAVPLVKGDGADGANIAAMQQEQKQGAKIRTHYSSIQFYDARHPRAAVGTDDEGNIYYVVIDGRFKGKGDGASIYETAYICRMLGMTQAINLDGGGSTTLWSEKTGVINHPYDNKKWDNEGERAVPNLIVAY